MPPSLTADFAAAMAALGPFEPHPAIAAAVSGGADSTALAILARDWVRQRDGTLLALVVDHGLRTDSAHEARITIERLTAIGIPARLLSLVGLHHGPAIAERARIARYAALGDACVQGGVLHLLIGHHAGDQIETLVMRVLRGSQTHGLAAMAGLREMTGMRLLRPLLGIEPARLRHFLTASGIPWVEDPSNHDIRSTRPRVRHGLASQSAERPRLVAAIESAGRLRRDEESEATAELARRARIRPEGFALLTHGRIGGAALGCLIQAIGGSAYPPNAADIRQLAAQPRPATIAGVRLLPAGRLGDGLLIVREEAAIGPPVRAISGATWDNRFRVIGRKTVRTDATIGKLGGEAARFRELSDLPSVILRTLPALRSGSTLLAVPHLKYATCDTDSPDLVLFTPQRPVGGACFVPAG